MTQCLQSYEGNNFEPGTRYSQSHQSNVMGILRYRELRACLPLTLLRKVTESIIQKNKRINQETRSHKWNKRRIHFGMVTLKMA